MSGIAGVIDFSGRAADDPSEMVRGLLLAMPHLGPAGIGLGTFAGGAIGEARTFESDRGERLIRTRDPDLQIVADVRLDERQELLAALEEAGDPLHDAPDAALVLAAYRRWGDACVDRLLGDFCFAIWDGQRRRVVLARDALGVRPCYVARESGRVAFCTELRPLLGLPGARLDPYEPRIADFLSLNFSDAQATFYEDIERLPPGHVLTIEASGVAARRYWTLELGPVLRLQDTREYTDAFRERLVAAVRCRLGDPSPVGFLLSGGLDSSSMVGIARQDPRWDAEAPITTISGLFPDYPEIDERRYIDHVLATGRFDPHFVRIDRISPLARLRDEVVRHGEPFYSPNNYVDSALLDRARDVGVRTILDGLDGDTTVGHGWELLGELFRRGRWRRMVRAAREFSRSTDQTFLWFLRRHAWAPTVRGLWAKLRGRRALRLPDIMAPGLAARTDCRERLWERAQGPGGPLAPFRSQHWRKLSSGLLPMSFELAAWQAGSRGLVRRHPYFDQRLVEFCVSLPAEQRFDRGADRMIQRRAVEGFAPDIIRRRLTKSIWEQNFADRIRTDDRSRLERLLSVPLDHLQPFLRLSKVRQQVEWTLAGRAGPRVLAQVWMVCALDGWLGSRQTLTSVGE